MIVLQEILRERMVASSRGSPGRLMDGASSSTKSRAAGARVVDLVRAVVQGLECLRVEQAHQKVISAVVVRDDSIQRTLLFPSV